MTIKECLSELIKFFDLFALTQFLRYNQDEDYKTISGGTTSLLVVVVFIYLFSGNTISTFNKTNITWSTTSENLFEPSRTTLTFSPETKNMFTVGILGLNLNDPSFRYFDFQII